MAEWAIALVSAIAGAVAGATLGFVGSVLVQRRQERVAEEHHRHELLATFYARWSILVAVMLQWPVTLPPTGLQRLRTMTLERSERVRQADWARAQREAREVFGDSLYEPLFLFVEAYARLRLIPLDGRVRAAIQAGRDYVERLADQRTDEVKDEWPALHAAFLAAVDESGDAPALDVVDLELAQEISHAAPSGIDKGDGG